MEIDRRTFLRTAMGAAGTLSLLSCGRFGGSSSQTSAPTTTVRLLPAGELSPIPRATLRLGGDWYGLPGPFSYLPPAFQHVNYIYDALLRLDSTRAVVPWLATRYERSADGLSYLFELRKDVRWHDGLPLTPEDVVFSFDYFAAKQAEGKVAPFVLFRPDHVADVRVTPNGAVEVRLDKPAVTFVDLASRFPIIPRHVWSSIDDPSNVRDLAVLRGTGPYRLKQQDVNGYLFTANDDYFLGAPFVKQVEIVRVADELAALEAGKIDVGSFGIRPVGEKVLETFRDDPSFGLVERRSDFTVALYWNLAKGGALADARFRRACALAIDRPNMVRRLLGGHGAAGNPGFLPPEHPMRVEVEQYAYNPASADRLLDEAGYTRNGSQAVRTADGKPLRLRLAADPALSAVVQALRQALRAVGIDLEVEPTTQFQIGSDYEMALMFYGGLQEDADYMRGVYSSRVPSKQFMAAQGYANPEFDDLADRQLVTLDEAARKAMVARMQEIVAADLPLLHLYYPSLFSIYRTAVIDAQWAGNEGNLTDKRSLVTGVADGLAIRPTT